MVTTTEPMGRVKSLACFYKNKRKKNNTNTNTDNADTTVLDFWGIRTKAAKEFMASCLRV